MALAQHLAPKDADLIDISSDGLSPDQQMALGPGYQVPFAHRIRREAGITTGTVGLISDDRQTHAFVQEGRADAVLIARQSLRDPYRFTAGALSDPSAKQDHGANDACCKQGAPPQ